MRRLDPSAPRRILVRATNWVGDAVMTLPALEALARACPQASIHVLAKPWVQAVYANAPGVTSLVSLDSEGHHAGPTGRMLLARELRERDYDWAVLFQNAFEAAIIAWLARVPVRVGYSTDARRLLLTNAVPRTDQDRRVHETSYYLRMLHQAGIIPDSPPDEGVPPRLSLGRDELEWAQDFLEGLGLGGNARLLGLAPGAAFGPAKRWPAERFALAAREMMGLGFDGVLLFGSASEAQTTAQVAGGLSGVRVVDLAGITGLGQALALLGRLRLLVTNDSGLMHAAAAQGTPTVAVFGSTNPVTTAPLGPWVSLVRKPVDCGPCLKAVCPLDLRCLTAVEPGEVAEAAAALLARRAGEAGK